MMKLLSRLVFYLFFVLIYLLSCKESTSTNKILKEIDTTAITGNAYIDNRIEKFSNEVKNQDHVSTLMIFICRRIKSTRISIIPIKTLIDTSFNFPTNIYQKKGCTYLIYNGSEMLNAPNEKLINQFSLVKKNLSSSYNTIYDPPVLQFDIFSSTNIKQIVPPENPYEQSAPENKIDFKPPH